jgi:hypothetical protein
MAALAGNVMYEGVNIAGIINSWHETNGGMSGINGEGNNNE